MIIVVINHSSISITEERLESDLVAGPCVKKSCLSLILAKTPWQIGEREHAVSLETTDAEIR